jgi:hypothetical protein
MNKRPVHYELLPREYTRDRLCALCGEVYVEGDHVGRLACWVHPGVRVTDSPPSSRYSCCGRRSDAGCVACDHLDLVLSRACIETRLHQLQQFAVKTWPAVLRRYLPAPRGATVVYSLPSDERQRADLPPIVLDFDVLAQARTAHQEALLQGARLLYDLDPPPLIAREFNPRVTLSPQTLLAQLAEQAQSSELFRREMSTKDERGLEIERLCNETWKNLGDDAKSKLECTIRFSLVRRLGGQ